MSKHNTPSDIPSRPNDASMDPVEGRSDGELWKRHRPEGEAPARSGGDEDVLGAVDPVNMEQYKAHHEEQHAPGLLDTATTPPAKTPLHQQDEEEVREILGPVDAEADRLDHRRRLGHIRPRQAPDKP